MPASEVIVSFISCVIETRMPFSVSSQTSVLSGSRKTQQHTDQCSNVLLFSRAESPWSSEHFLYFCVAINYLCSGKLMSVYWICLKSPTWKKCFIIPDWHFINKFYLPWWDFPLQFLSFFWVYHSRSSLQLCLWSLYGQAERQMQRANYMVWSKVRLYLHMYVLGTGI